MKNPHTLRVCTRCGKEKPRDEFSKSKHGRDGLHSYCKQCMTEYMSGRREHVAHVPKPCGYCGNEFTPRNAKALYCSNNCKMRERYWRLNPPEQRVCPVCDKDITKMRREAIYCSPACREKQRRRDGRVTKEESRRRQLQRYHKITLEDYDRMLAEQGGVCAICGTDSPGTPHGYWHTDHDHSCCPGRGCGKCVRGLLCGACNLGLGQFQDDPSRLEAAADYLRRSQCPASRNESLI